MQEDDDDDGGDDDGQGDAKCLPESIPKDGDEVFLSCDADEVCL